METGLPGYQSTNFAVACAAAREHLGTLDPEAVARVAARITVPGRLQVVGDAPVTILDGAHNPSGIVALAAALPDREWTGVVSILDDKDAGAMLRALLGRCRRIVCTAAPNPRALPAGDARLARRAARRRGRDRPRAARRATTCTRTRRPGGRGDRDRIHLPHSGPRVRTRGQEGLCTVNERGPNVLGMIALVAVVVALTILIFFALGYAFGRMFL